MSELRKQKGLHRPTYLPWVADTNDSFNQKRILEQKDQIELLEKNLAGIFTFIPSYVGHVFCSSFLLTILS